LAQNTPKYIKIRTRWGSLVLRDVREDREEGGERKEKRGRGVLAITLFTRCRRP